MQCDLIDALRAQLPHEFSVDSYIKKGGQGAVFRGTHSGTPAAIKLFQPNANPERIRREIDALGNIDSPHLVKILASCPITFLGQLIYIVAYELVDGSDLAQVITSGSLPDQVTLLSVGAATGDAIEALWSRRIVHRDIKPANIMCGRDGRVVVVDVGLAQHLELDTITHAAGQPGTDGYRSPEQCAGRTKLTVHSDVFSLGVTLWEYATGKHPWQRNQRLVGKVPLAHLSASRSDIDARLCSLIHRMLRLVPSERPANPGQIFAQLTE